MAKRKQGAGPGGGEPDSRREGSPEPGPAAKNGRGRTRAPYTPEDRRRLVEAFAKSGMTVRDFCRTTGMSDTTLKKWRRRYEAEGPRGLEGPGPGRPRGSGTGSRLAPALRDAIAQTKRRFPDFGLRRLRDYVGRFLHLRVSEGGVRGVVREMGLPAALRPPRPKRRRSEEPRRFERARPGDLWQSDITGYRLARHDRRVYLTVFLDDCSRYVVAWKLALHQRQELVTECLLDGIQRYGKPREVLTDQGRQYFAWRGRSDFQRLLEREGIRHVVARAHHPETVGKCERLWKTVGEELWERTHPEELEEARERLVHYFSFYNHRRPHQGLEGMTPADRFFGAEALVRGELEAAMDRNELALALGEAPRRRVFLVGQVGGRQVSLHGEKGRLVLETGDGHREEIGMETLGIPGGKDRSHGGDDEADAAVSEEDALRGAAAGGGAGAGAVGGGERGGAEEGARDGGGDPEDLAREGDEGGGGGGAGGDGAAAVAAEPDGGLGDGGGAAAAATQPAGAGAVGGGGAAAPGGGAGEGARGDAGAGEDPRADAGAPGHEDRRCGTAASAGTRSDGGCGSGEESCGEGEGRSPGATS